MPGNPNPTEPPRKTRVDGVLVQDLSWYTDQRGSLSVLLRNDAEALLGGEFGQAYVTTILPDVVKAWHRHEHQWDRMVGLVGETLLVLVDGRADSGTRGERVEVVLGTRHPCLVLIPPGVWHGLKGISDRESIVLNLPTRAYAQGAPDEQRAPPHEPLFEGQAGYKWRRQDG